MPTPYKFTVTDAEIRSLRDEAKARGDVKLATKCVRALNGSYSARIDVNKYLRRQRALVVDEPSAQNLLRANGASACDIATWQEVWDRDDD